MSKLLSVDTIYSAFGDPGRIYPYPAEVKAAVSSDAVGDLSFMIESDLILSGKTFAAADLNTNVHKTLNLEEYSISASVLSNTFSSFTGSLADSTIDTRVDSISISSGYFEADINYPLSDHQVLLTIDTSFVDESDVPEPTTGFQHVDLVGGGDALITRDNNTGLEWLKVKNTEGMSIHEVENDPQFEGWRVANNFEAIEYLNNIILSVDANATLFEMSNGSPEISRSYPTEINSAIKEYIGGSSSTVSYGWWYEYAYNQPTDEPDGFGGGGLWSNGSIYDWRYSHAKDYSRSGTGVMLVRNGVRPDYITQQPKPPNRENFVDADYAIINGLSWLKLYHTKGMSVSSISANEEFNDHRIATESEVKQLMEYFVGESVSLNNSGPSGSKDAATVDQWYKLMGRSGISSGYVGYGNFIADANGYLSMAGFRDLSNYYYFGYTRSTNVDAAPSQDGIFLVKE